MGLNGGWRAGRWGVQAEPLYLPEALQPPSAALPGGELVPTPLTMPLSRQAWAIEKGTGSSSRDSCGSREPPKAPELVTHQFSPPKGNCCYLPPSPKSFPLPPGQSSLGMRSTHRSRPASPRQQQETWPALTGAQDPQALTIWGSSYQGQVGGSGRARREHKDGASQDPGLGDKDSEMPRRNQPGAGLDFPLPPGLFWLWGCFSL